MYGAPNPRGWVQEVGATPPRTQALGFGVFLAFLRAGGSPGLPENWPRVAGSAVGAGGRRGRGSARQRKCCILLRSGALGRAWGAREVG